MEQKKILIVTLGAEDNNDKNNVEFTFARYYTNLDGADIKEYLDGAVATGVLQLADGKPVTRIIGARYEIVNTLAFDM